MTYEMTVELKSNYLHATVTGENTRENVSAYLKDLLAECVNRQCNKVLIEERLAGPRLGIVDIYQIITEGAFRAREFMETIAVVDIYAAKGGLLHFARSLAASMGLPFHLFDTVEEAAAWLGEHS